MVKGKGLLAGSPLFIRGISLIIVKVTLLLWRVLFVFFDSTTAAASTA